MALDDDRILCPPDDCLGTFSNLFSLERHIKRLHNEYGPLRMTWKVKC